METVRKTYKEQLRPTPAQERALEQVLWRRRTLYNTALEQRARLSLREAATAGIGYRHLHPQGADVTTLFG